jgi:hypothetical protein
MARERESEAEAVRTTIVGGRPPGSGRSNVPVPRGIEVLVKKAAVDAEFRELLLTRRGSAADSIELELDPAECAILNVIPREQLARIVDQTEVGTELRPAFLGRAAAVMLAALGAGLVSASGPAGAQSEPSGPTAQAQATGVSTPPFQKYEVAYAILGAQTDLVPTNSPGTNSPPATTNVLNTTNIYSGRTVITAGATIILDEPLTNPAPTNAEPPGVVTNQPPTNRPPSSGRVTPPFRPAMFAVMIQPAPPKPPSSNPPASTPSANKP